MYSFCVYTEWVTVLAPKVAEKRFNALLQAPGVLPSPTLLPPSSPDLTANRPKKSSTATPSVSKKPAPLSFGPPASSTGTGASFGARPSWITNLKGTAPAKKFDTMATPSAVKEPTVLTTTSGSGDSSVKELITIDDDDDDDDVVQVEPVTIVDVSVAFVETVSSVDIAPCADTVTPAVEESVIESSNTAAPTVSVSDNEVTVIDVTPTIITAPTVTAAEASTLVVEKEEEVVPMPEEDTPVHVEAAVCDNKENAPDTTNISSSPPTPNRTTTATAPTTTKTPNAKKTTATPTPTTAGSTKKEASAKKEPKPKKSTTTSSATASAPGVNSGKKESANKSGITTTTTGITTAATTSAMKPGAIFNFFSKKSTV